MVAVRETVSRPPQDISEPLSNNFPIQFDEFACESRIPTYINTLDRRWPAPFPNST
jgi:hypothetical protein